MKVKLIKHNSEEQMDWGSNDDTREFLEVGKIYEATEEVHSYHTKYIIDEKEFNSVVFEVIE